MFAGDPQVPGHQAADLRPERGESVRRQASRSWHYLLRGLAGLRAARAGRRRRRPRPIGTGSTRERLAAVLLRELGFRRARRRGQLRARRRRASRSATGPGDVPIHLLGWATDLDHKTPHVAARAPQSMLQELPQPRRRLPVGDPVQRRARCGCCATRPRWSAPPTSSSTSRRSSTASCSPTSCCSTWSATSPGSRSRTTAAPRPATWNSGAASPSSRASGRSISSATASSRPSPCSAPDSCPPGQPAAARPRSTRQRDLKLDDLNRALLRLVYRLLFWFVAEDRGALLQPDPRRRRRPGQAARGPRPVRRVLLLRPAAPARPPPPRQQARRPVRRRAARLRRPRHRGRRPRAGPARHRRHLRVHAATTDAAAAGRAARRRPPVQRGPARRASAPCPW